MKIVQLEAENFKRLKAVKINPTSSIVEISGDNEQGKTSVLDAIWSALGHADMAKSTGTVNAVRNGEEKGFIRLDLGDLIVTRKITNSGSTVTVESAEGAKYGTPQKILDGLISRIAIDPQSFSEMPEKQQRETLLKIINLPIDLENLASFKKGAFDRRTDLNRNIKMLESQLMGLPETPQGTPENEISQASIMEEIEAAQRVVNANAIVRRDFDQNEKNISSLREEIKRVEGVLENLKSRLDVEGIKHINLSEQVSKLVDPDMTSFKARLAEIEKTNENVRVKKQSDKICAQISDLRNQVIVQESKMAAIDKEKSDALENAKFPIPGLSISDDGVLYKGVPFSQCSSAERLRVSISIAMAISPKLRVIRITDGSLIGPKNMAIIEEMAKENDYQIWIERVDTSGKVGVYIEDGEVKAIN
jgi:hypothetical protein